MNRENKDIYFLLLDIPADIEKQFEQNCPSGCRIVSLKELEKINQESGPNCPAVFFLPVEKWENISTLDIFGGDLSIQVVLVVTERISLDAYDFPPPENFLGYLYLPVNRKKLTYFKNRVAEVHNLYLDLYHMAREIALERELLARKNEQLAFLNRILAKATLSLDVSEILDMARKEFDAVLDTKALLGVFWQEENDLEAQIYLPSTSPGLEQKWIEYLLQASQRFNQKMIKNYQVNYLAYKVDDCLLKPQTWQLILIPLKIGQKTFGALAVVTSQASNLGRDQVQILQSAGNHLGLAIRNALKYKKVRIQADHDGLTRVYNRQSFDKRLRLELKRHQRHGHSLSLLMLDLDYFKKINDTYGHLAGDMVLQRIARLLKNTVRETDFVARYGGEEFVLLLPETSEEDAWLLAQRIRQNIQKIIFSFQGKRFNVTASIGVASLRPDPFTPADVLINRADEALYLAKNSGRNMVCTTGGHRAGRQCLQKCN